MPGVMPSAFLSRKLRNASGMPGTVDRPADGSLPAFPGGTPSPLLTAPVAGSTVKTREAWPAEDGLALVPAEPGHGPGVSVERWSPRNMRCNSALASLSRPSRVSRIAFSMSADILGSMAVILLPFRTGRSVGLPQRKTARMSGNVCLTGGTPCRRRRQRQRLQSMRSANAAFTAGLACNVPSTETEAIAARASSGVTSDAIVTRPRTRMSNGRCAARARSSSSRL